jgi:tRNA(Ile)-lysidine synthase
MPAADELTPDRLAAALAPATCRRLWIAYSGGLDSHVLLHAADGLRRELRLDLRAVHIHHGLQPAADDWARHCAEVCGGLGVPLETRRVAPQPGSGSGPEAAAREARYGAFRALLRPDEMLATAQHRDDQAETLLLALLRGAGVHGLAAMPAQAPLGAGTLLRPLLDLPRAALAAYARAHGLRWVEDPSNRDPMLDRNRLRHLVVPELRRRWPGLDKTLSRSADHCAEAAGLLDELADELLAGLGAGTAVVDGLPAALSIAGLRRLTGPKRRLVLRRWLGQRGFPLPDMQRLHRITAELLNAAADRQPLVAWPGCEVRRHRDALHALAPLPPLPAGPLLPAPGACALALPAPLGVLSWGLDPAWDPARDSTVADARISVQFAAAGLRCARVARPSADLKAVFQEAGIPAWLRPYVPLLILHDRLAGVGGVRLCGGGLAWLRWEGHPWAAEAWLATHLENAQIDSR